MDPWPHGLSHLWIRVARLEINRLLQTFCLQQRNSCSETMSHVFADIRFALRSFAKAPVFTVVAITSLALGIGANTAIFTLMDQVLLRALPVQDPEQLVLVFSRGSH